MPSELLVAATTLTVPATVPAFVVSEDRGSHSAPIATFTGERAQANAQLFAAAPDLLAACKGMYRELLDIANGYIESCLFREQRDLWAAAIAKAEGGAS